MENALRSRTSEVITEQASDAPLSVRRSPWLPSLCDWVFLIGLFLAVRRGGGLLSADGDAARHLTVGAYILDKGSIPREDVFSHTMGGAPFVPYEWLAEVASALSYRWAGLAGPVLLHAVVIGLTLAVLLVHLRSRSHAGLLALAVVGLVLSTSQVHWIARPHLFTLLGTAVFAAVLDGWYAGRVSYRWLYILPVAMMLWVNLHGGFLIGLILLGVYCTASLLRWMAEPPSTEGRAGQQLRELIPVAVLTLGATLINPAGLGLLEHVIGYLDNRLLVDRTSEYRSPNFHDTWPRLFLVTILLTAASLGWSRRRPALHEGLLFLGFLAFALYSQRNIPLFAIVTAPMLASQLENMPPIGGRLHRVSAAIGRWIARRNAVAERVDRRGRGHLWPTVVVAALLLITGLEWRNGSSPLGVEFLPTRLPVEAVAYLKSNPPTGNGFGVMHWGGYLLHELWPAQRVFIDGQTDFYGEDLFRDYLKVAELSAGWEEVLAQYDVQWIVYQTDSPVVRALAANPEWRVTHRDDLATVLVRTNSTGP